jgi:hypothetical protein
MENGIEVPYIEGIANHGGEPARQRATGLVEDGAGRNRRVGRTRATSILCSLMTMDGTTG